MSCLTTCALGLLLCAADPNAELKIESALLTLIEHADVSASEAGLLTQLVVKEGGTIEEGKPLALLDNRDVKLIRDRADTELKIARALADNDIKVRFAKKSAEVAEAELRRAVESNEKFPKSVSQSEIDRLKLLADKAVLEIEQADHDLSQLKLSVLIKQHELERATLLLERRSIVAPFPGMVVQWKRQRGEWVEPGTPVMRLIRLNRLRAEAFLAAQSIPTNLVGRPVTLFVETPAEKSPAKYEGKLVFVSREVDPVNGQVRVWAEVENHDLALSPGQTATLIVAPAK